MITLLSPPSLGPASVPASRTNLEVAELLALAEQVGQGLTSSQPDDLSTAAVATEMQALRSHRPDLMSSAFLLASLTRSTTSGPRPENRTAPTVPSAVQAYLALQVMSELGEAARQQAAPLATAGVDVLA